MSQGRKDPKDPFGFDDDRTVLQPHKPTARGSRPDGPSPASSSSVMPLAGQINDLERAASRLLPLFVTLKNSSTIANPDALRTQLIEEIEQFKLLALKILNDPRRVTEASYVMCTVLDEAAMNTPWGHQANWAQFNLLSTFHNEVAGGKKFFELLKYLGRDPSKNIELLELMFVCLSLGYEGAYRIAPNGQEKLVKVRQWLYEIIHSVRGRQGAALSAHWSGTQIRDRSLPRMTPLWVMSAGSLAFASILFLSLRFALTSHANDAIDSFWGATVAELSVNEIARPSVKPALVTEINEQALTLEQLLRDEIEAKRVDVADTFEYGRITVLGNDLFRSGSNILNQQHFSTVAQIASALDKFDGEIVVTGHSDNIPIGAGRWASNLELSKARAESVRSLLSESLQDPLRLSALGRGSLEPIADNSTPEGRSANRRVEITLFY